LNDNESKNEVEELEEEDKKLEDENEGEDDEDETGCVTFGKNDVGVKNDENGGVREKGYDLTNEEE
jgi:hypothetical protein